MLTDFRPSTTAEHLLYLLGEHGVEHLFVHRRNLCHQHLGTEAAGQARRSCGRAASSRADRRRDIGACACLRGKAAGAQCLVISRIEE